MLSVGGDEMPSKMAETQMEFVNARTECTLQAQGGDDGKRGKGRATNKLSSDLA